MLPRGDLKLALPQAHRACPTEGDAGRDGQLIIFRACDLWVNGEAQVQDSGSKGTRDLCVCVHNTKAA